MKYRIEIHTDSLAELLRLKEVYNHDAAEPPSYAKIFKNETGDEVL